VKDQHRPSGDDVSRKAALAESMLAAILDFVYVFNLRTGEYVHSNGELRAFLGYAPDQVEWMNESEFSTHVAHPDDAERYRAMLDENRALVPGGLIIREVRLRNGDGAYRWYRHTVVGLRFDDEGVVETLGTLNDITSVIESAKRVRDSERRFRQLFDRSPAGTVVIDDDGMTLEANEAMASLTGVRVLDLVGSQYDTFVHPDERADVARRRLDMAGSENAASPVQRRLVHSDGTIRWVQVLITRIEENDRYVTLLAFDDVTAERAAMERLEHAALHDSLTGLPNRRLLADRLNQALHRSRRTGCLAAVLFLDLDRVKRINDSFGHAVGDAVLTMVGQRLAHAVRESDTVARVGGDEFVVVCEGVEDPDEITELADRVLAVIAEPLCLGGKDLSLTASIGIATSRGDASANELLGAADMAMYEAKSAGRARIMLAPSDA
jgi:diguanylate cyclase (GGDEF)-like protein/PAS domain S-box-containing protein